jgi:hypothetical protein
MRLIICLHGFIHREQPPGFAIPLVDSQETLLALASISDVHHRVNISFSETPDNTDNTKWDTLQSVIFSNRLDSKESSILDEEPIGTVLSLKDAEETSSIHTFKSAKETLPMEIVIDQSPRPNESNSMKRCTSEVMRTVMAISSLKGWVSKRIRNVKKQKYHHRATPFNGIEHSMITRESIDDILHYSRYAEVVYNSDDAEILYKNNILRMNTDNNLYHSPYLITYDSEYDTIVLAIRGTWSLYDVFTDLKMQEEEFEIEDLEGEKCFAHRGNVESLFLIIG